MISALLGAYFKLNVDTISMFFFMTEFYKLSREGEIILVSIVSCTDGLLAYRKFFRVPSLTIAI